jgi:hypothetical protein
MQVSFCQDDAVSIEGGVAQPGFTPPLPTSVWLVAWASLPAEALS